MVNLRSFFGLNTVKPHFCGLCGLFSFSKIDSFDIKAVKHLFIEKMTMPFKNLILEVIDSFWLTLAIGQFKNKFMLMIN